MQNFRETNHCAAGVHCRTCRDRESGRYWRLMLAQIYALPGDVVDFDCPHGKPWGFVETESETARRSKPKQDSADGEAIGEGSGETGKDRHYSLPPDVREKLRDVFLQFRTACYQNRSLHGCECELQTMGGCGLKTTLKNTGRLICEKAYFPVVRIDEPFRQQLNECEEN